ncbi:MAG: peptidyl-prolyl cis-trans isomerase [archaeon]|nr:peptidyl-prolyl cis-trans isomerase [archaeon]
MVQQVRAAHILVKTREEAMDIYQQIQQGADFAALAKARSTCPSGRNGGDLGWFGRGQMVKPFEDVCFGYNTGDFTVVQTQFGWHVIYIIAQR